MEYLDGEQSSKQIGDVFFFPCPTASAKPIKIHRNSASRFDVSRQQSIHSSGHDRALHNLLYCSTIKSTACYTMSFSYTCKSGSTIRGQ
ncbi:hypothetical protein ACLOJK_037478 [Asimina triloba]